MVVLFSCLLNSSHYIYFNLLCSQNIPPDEACMQSAFGETGLSPETFSFASIYLGILVSSGFDHCLFMNRWWKDLMGDHMAQGGRKISESEVTC